MAITNASRLASYVGAAITADGASGIVTAQSFHGDGANLINVGVDTAQVSTSGLVVSGVSTLAGATFSGVSTFSNNVTFEGNLDLQDDDKILVGTGNDLEIYHDGTDTTIDNNTGDLNITTSGSGDDIYLDAADDIFIRVQGNESAITATGNGAVELYYDNSKKFETDAGGVKITGVVTATSFSGSGSGLTGLNIPAGFNELDAALFN